MAAIWRTSIAPEVIIMAASLPANAAIDATSRVRSVNRMPRLDGDMGRSMKDEGRRLKADTDYGEGRRIVRAASTPIQAIGP